MPLHHKLKQKLHSFVLHQIVEAQLAEQEDKSKEMKADWGDKKDKQPKGDSGKPFQKDKALKGKSSSAVKEAGEEKHVEERTKGGRKASAAAMEKERKRAKKAAKLESQDA